MHGRQSMRGTIIEYGVFDAEASCDSPVDMDELEPTTEIRIYSIN